MSADAAQRAANFLGFDLPKDSPLQQGRLQALATGLTGDLTPTSLVSFSSSGVLAIVGPLPSALAVAQEPEGRPPAAVPTRAPAAWSRRRGPGLGT